jgi:hypothetical protein
MEDDVSLAELVCMLLEMMAVAALSAQPALVPASVVVDELRDCRGASLSNDRQSSRHDQSPST